MGLTLILLPLCRAFAELGLGLNFEPTVLVSDLLTTLLALGSMYVCIFVYFKQADMA